MDTTTTTSQSSLCWARNTDELLRNHILKLKMLQRNAPTKLEAYTKLEGFCLTMRLSRNWTALGNHDPLFSNLHFPRIGLINVTLEPNAAACRWSPFHRLVEILLHWLSGLAPIHVPTLAAALGLAPMLHGPEPANPFPHIEPMPRLHGLQV